MSKRNKKIRSNRPAFKLEALEQRQLLATIVDNQGGTEVVSDVTLANGNTYDQILMTGSTITVESDWNAATGTYNVTRVDFLDADGDLVRAEFAGPGRLTISLADFQEAAPPEFYETDVEYVQGVANFRITGSTENTNFGVHSLGTVNVFNGAANPIFDGGEKTGGNNWANITRIVVESDGGALGNAFGGIRAGNAVFGGDFGAIGVIAPDAQFFGPIVIGGIEATDDAVALLQIGQFSSNKTVTLAGTDLTGSDAAVDIENVDAFIMASGQSSMGELVETQEYEPTAVDEVVADISYTSAAATVTLNEDTTEDELEELATKYLNHVIIEDSFVDSEGFIAEGGFTAKLIGDVTVKGDLDFVIEATELSIGDVVIEGTILDGGKIVANADIGDVKVVEDIDFTDDDYTAGGSLIAAGGNVGNVTFEGDVLVQDDDAVALITAGGNIGNISGAKLENAEKDVAIFTATAGNIGTIDFTGDIEIAGAITAKGNIGDISGDNVTTAAITAQDGKVGAITADGDLVLGAVNTDDGIGAVSAGGDATLAGLLVDVKGNIGDITAGGSLVIDGAIDTDDGKIGAISAAGDESGITVNAMVTATVSIGNITVSGDESNLTIAAASGFSAGTGTIGDVTVASGGIDGVTGQVEFAAKAIGNVSVTGHEDTAVLLSDVIFAASGEGASIGHINLDGSETDGAIADSAAGSTTAVTGTGFSSSGNIGNITITAHDDGKILAATDDVLVFRAGNSNMGATTADTAEDTVSIGNVTIEGNLAAGLGNGPGTGLAILSGVSLGTAGVFVEANGTDTAVAAPAKDGDGSIGAITITDIGGTGVTGFNSNALAADAGLTGGSAIVANSIGAITIEAGETITVAATATARKGALDITANEQFDDNGDLFIVVL